MAVMSPRRRKYDFNNPEDVARYRETLAGNAARRVRTLKRCAQCGVEFRGWAVQVYCSGNCRQKAYEHRKKATQRERPAGSSDGD